MKIKSQRVTPYNLECNVPLTSEEVTLDQRIPGPAL